MIKYNELLKDCCKKPCSGTVQVVNNVLHLLLILADTKCEEQADQVLSIKEKQNFWGM
jgi:hypothetical protein